MSAEETDRSTPKAFDGVANDASGKPERGGTDPRHSHDAEPRAKRDETNEAIERATAVFGSEEPQNRGR